MALPAKCSGAPGTFAYHASTSKLVSAPILEADHKAVKFRGGFLRLGDALNWFSRQALDTWVRRLSLGRFFFFYKKNHGKIH